jgi:hypothetical protein
MSIDTGIETAVFCYLPCEQNDNAEFCTAQEYKPENNIQIQAEPLYHFINFVTFVSHL